MFKKLINLMKSFFNYRNPKGGGGNTTPPPPTNLVINDTLNLATFDNATGYAATDHEYSSNNGASWTDCLSNSISVGNVSIPAGYFQVRVKAATGRNASSIISNTIPFTVSGGSGADVSAYPALAVSNGPSGITAPGTSFTATSSLSAVSAAPIIAEWEKTAYADMHISLAAHQLNGLSTTVKLYNGSTVVDGSVSVMDTQKGMIKVPSTIGSWGFYVLWVGNASGYSSPVTLNKTKLDWSMSTIAEGMTVKLFGQNLSSTNDDSGICSLFIRVQGGASGTGQFITTVTRVTPNDVEFTCPVLTPGTYEIWAHNNLGGDYGWSDPLTITVVDKQSHILTRDSWTTVTLNDPNGTDDTSHIASVLSASGDYTKLQFKAGTYYVSATLANKIRQWWMGAPLDVSGNPTTIIKLKAPFTTGSNGFFNNSLNFNRIENIKFDQNIIATKSGQEFARVNYTDVYWNNCYIDCKGFTALYGNWNKVYFYNTTVIGGYNQWASTINMDGGKQVFLYNSKFRHTNDCTASVINKGVSEAAIQSCDFRDLDPSTDQLLSWGGTGWGKGRIWSSAGNKGGQQHIYFSNNVGYGLGVRRTGVAAPNDGSGVDPNSGEILLWESTASRYIGTPSTVDNTAKTITFASGTVPSTAVDGTANAVQFATIVKGKGLGQTRRIVTYNSATQITLDKAWNVVPDNTSSVVIGPSLYNAVFYKNTFGAEGKPYIAGPSGTQPTSSAGYAGTGNNFDHTASTCISFYGANFNCRVSDLTANGTRAGITIFPSQHNENYQDSCFFITVDNINFNGCRWGTQIEAYKWTYWNGSANVLYNNVDQILAMCILFRKGTITGTKVQTINTRTYPADLSYQVNTTSAEPVPLIDTIAYDYIGTDQLDLTTKKIWNWKGTSSGQTANPQSSLEPYTCPTGTVVNEVFNNITRS